MATLISKDKTDEAVGVSVIFHQDNKLIVLFDDRNSSEKQKELVLGGDFDSINSDGNIYKATSVRIENYNTMSGLAYFQFIIELEVA